MKHKPCCLATGIGSLPHSNLDEAMRLVETAIPQLPYMPQLPEVSWHEGMMVQYTEGFPGLALDEAREKLTVDTDQAMVELEDFYGRIIEDDPEKFAISEGNCRGLLGLKECAGTMPSIEFLKTQVTGPVTQGLSTVDQTKRAIFYDGTLQEAVVQTCCMKARWLVRALSSYGPPIICFVDEPILSAFGSSVYVSITHESVVAQLREVAAAIRAEGALCGVHCCGNTDWTLLTDAEVDIISFDAFEFAFSLPLYPEAIRAFFERGGVVAWGIVPTSEVVLEHSVDSLYNKLLEAFSGVEELGISRQTLHQQALITPACGLGSTSVEVAEQAFTLLHDLSQRLREEALAEAPNA